MRKGFVLTAVSVFSMTVIVACSEKSAEPEQKTTDLVSLTPDQRERFATIANLNGHLCAKVIEARKREAQTYYIECEKYSDKLERRAYTIDLATGKAR